jgi:hypothetical protein
LCQAEEQNSELCYLWFLLFKFVLAIFCSFASLREVLTSLVAASSPVIFCGYPGGIPYTGRTICGASF